MATDQTPKESGNNTNQGPDEPNNTWGLSDKIAVYATIAGFLQFVVLAFTVWAMIHHARRQLRAYVLPDTAGIVDGTMLNPPVPDKVNVPGVVILIKNSGQTPAYKVVSWAQLAVIPVRDENLLVTPPLIERFFNTLGREAVFNKVLWFDRPLVPNELVDPPLG